MEAQRSGGELDMQFFGSTLLNKELEIMNAVKSGNIAIGNPGGAAATVFPEMGVFLVPYLVQSYDQAYKMFNGKIGDTLDKQFQEKYKLKTLCFFDYGFRHFWTSKKAIVEPKDPANALVERPSATFAPSRTRTWRTSPQRRHSIISVPIGYKASASQTPRPSLEGGTSQPRRRLRCRLRGRAIHSRGPLIPVGEATNVQPDDDVNPSSTWAGPSRLGSRRLRCLRRSRPRPCRS